MAEAPYAIARAAAARVHPHFAGLLTAQRGEGASGLAPLPDIATVETLIDVAFWASLRREELRAPRISLAFAPPIEGKRPLVFGRPVPLAPQPLTHLGPAVERPGIHLCVERRGGELSVWGAARYLPPCCFVLEVVAPGLLVIKHSRPDDSGKFVNVAVLQGDEIKMVDQNAARLAGLPPRMAALLSPLPDLASPDVNVLMQLAVSMRAHAQGGTLLVVPSDETSWHASILEPIPYAITPAFGLLGDLAREPAAEKSSYRWQTTMRRALEGLGGLTAVDGAMILTDRFDLAAFGAKIIRRSGYPQVDTVVLTEAIEGAGIASVDSSVLGGTRHLSAAQFTHDQRDSLALVASQDGRFTAFEWSPDAQMVFANRIEALLL
ncbi:MAG TPA: hypothetical protein VG297_09780 [Bryobacteraceae bacterium]|jgi:hypothetical protein|nr:hypothetical protein [Bryobacteraceae bacterium]